MVDALREALEPFARWAEWFDGMALSDDHAVHGRTTAIGAAPEFIRLGDLRRARQALSSSSGERVAVPAGTVSEFRALHEAARGREFDLTPADGPIARLTLFVHQHGDAILAALNQPHGNKQDQVREALTPSGETKAAYMGEFSWSEWLQDADGIEQGYERVVPWQTIKEIMRAIRERAGLDLLDKVGRLALSDQAREAGNE